MVRSPPILSDKKKGAENIQFTATPEIVDGESEEDEDFGKWLLVNECSFANWKKKLSPLSLCM